MTPSDRIYFEPLWRHMTPSTRALALGWYRVANAISWSRRRLIRIAEAL